MPSASQQSPDPVPPPGFQGRFVAELLTGRAADLADMAAAELVASSPGLAARYQPLPRRKWMESYTGRIHDLAAAVLAELPSLFADQAAWARVAFEARAAPVADLRAGLAALRSVVVREVPPEDSRFVASYFDAALAVIDSPSPAAPPPLSIATPAGRTGAEYLLKLLEGERVAAAKIVTDAVAAGLGVRHAYTQVLVPVQRELGRMWHLGEISVAEEHFATATTLMVMSQLLPMAARPPRNGRTVLAAAVEGNTHDLGVRLLADFFEMEGWRSIYLGASVPAEDLATAAADFRVDLVALSAALCAHFPAVESTIRTLRDTLGPACPRIMVGGCAFAGAGEAAWKRLGADAFAADIDAALAAAAHLAPTAGGPAAYR